MKNLNYILAISFLLVAGMVKAQFDDLYFDPETDESYYYDEFYSDDDYDYFDDDEYDNYDEYDYWRDYDNYYTSRIRRFHRPWVRMGFYNSWAYNSLFYDPFDFYGPYGGFGGTFVSIGFGTPFYGVGFGNPGWNSWGYNNWGWNSWGYNSWGWNSWGGFGNPYCPPYYGGGLGYGPGYVGNVLVVNSYNQQSNPKGTYYGSRRGGSTSSSVKGVRDNPRGGATNNEILNPGVRGQDDTRGQAIAGNNEIRSPRRTDVRNDELAVSRLSDRPGRSSVLDGTERGSSSVSERRSQRPTRRSVSPYTDRNSSVSPVRRNSYDYNERSSVRREYPSSRRSDNSVMPRQSTRGNNNFPSSSRTSPSRSTSPARSGGGSSPRSSSGGSGGSSPRRGG